VIAALQCGVAPLTPIQALTTVGIVVLSILFLFALLWTVLRFAMPGEERALTDAFRRRKA
jgi:protein-S-isoprenylcysteine O-methyltransferase Ste14